MSEGNNAKCPLKYRTVPHIKALVSQMLMVEKHWTKRQNKGSGIIFCIYYGIRGGRGEGLFELVALVKIKAVGKREWSFSVLLSVGMPCTGFARPQLSQSLMIHADLNTPIGEARASQAPGEGVHPVHQQNVENPRKRTFPFFFFSFQQTAKLRRGQL